MPLLSIKNFSNEISPLPIVLEGAFSYQFYNYTFIPLTVYLSQTQNLKNSNTDIIIKHSTHTLDVF